MKKRIITIGCIAAVAIFMSLIGRAILWSPPTTETVTRLIPIDNAVSIYENASAAFQESGSAVMEITAKQQLITNGEVLTEVIDQSLSYSGYNSEELMVTSNELFSVGDHTVQITESYSTGTAYVSIEGSNFRSTLAFTEYQSRIMPATLMDPALYRNIKGYDNGSEYHIYFEQPTEIESWAAKDGWKLAGAKGFAIVSHSGELLKSAYALTYASGSDILHRTLDVDHSQTAPMIVVPEDPQAYTQISYLDAPRMLERASGYLLQSSNIIAKYNDRIFCQAFGDERTKSIALYTADSNGFSARIDTDTILTNTGHIGDNTRHLHNELFINGAYTLRADHGESAPNETITAEAMDTYCKNQLVSTIMMPQDLLNSECHVLENTLKIVITPNEAFAELLSSNACQTLYQNPSVLNDLATGHSTEKLECYLEISKTTGLPVGAGIEYDGSYTIEGIPYRLQYKADQSYSIANSLADGMIKEAAGQ